jgi:hypothetical protein
MGLCSSGLTEEQRQAIQESNALDKVLGNNMQDEQKVVKLLLLGMRRLAMRGACSSGALTHRDL